MQNNNSSVSTEQSTLFITFHNGGNAYSSSSRDLYYKLNVRFSLIADSGLQEAPYVPEAEILGFELSIKVHTVSENVNCPIWIIRTGLTHQ